MLAGAAEGNTEQGYALRGAKKPMPISHSTPHSQKLSASAVASVTLQPTQPATQHS